MKTDRIQSLADPSRQSDQTIQKMIRLNSDGIVFRSLFLKTGMYQKKKFIALEKPAL